MNKPLVALTSLWHFVPGPFGASPIGSIALYAGAYGDARTAWLTPLVPLLIGDLLSGFYDVRVMAFVYLGFALSAVVGRLFLSARRNVRRFALAIVSAAVVFYLVSNFSMWLVGFYPHTTAGLASCYVNGLPYLLGSVIADSVYCVLLFGAHAMLERKQLGATTA